MANAVVVQSLRKIRFDKPIRGDDQNSTLYLSEPDYSVLVAYLIHQVVQNERRVDGLNDVCRTRAEAPDNVNGRAAGAHGTVDQERHAVTVDLHVVEIVTGAHD